MTSDLDLTFLDASLWASTSAVPPPVNIYDILREGWRETRVDMTLEFLLNPKERHGLGSLVIDALLTTLDGAPLSGSTGLTADRLRAEDHQGSTEWEIKTQSDYIDVLATNTDTGLAIVLENKIDHVLDNPLAKYATSALGSESVRQVLVVVLAPTWRAAPAGQENWLSRSITYTELAEAIRRSPELLEHLLDPVDRDQRRSLDLLQQFIEARTGGTAVNRLRNEAAALDEWRSLVGDNADAIAAFLEAQRGVRSAISDRRKRLEPFLAERLDTAGLARDWESHGGARDEAWNAYHFTDFGWSVELKFSADPRFPTAFIYSYPGLRNYRDAVVDDLGIPWSEPDEVFVDAFMAGVEAILRIPSATHAADSSGSNA